MPRRRSTKIGRVQPPLDVRKENEIPQFESMLSIGPLTVVLVYADWCGHCTRFKENMWNKTNAMPNKSVNTASVHYDMLDKTSLKNSKIEGYPSLLLVGTDKKPANFKAENGSVTNAMPQPTSAEELKSMLASPITEPVKNANSIVKAVVNNARNNLRKNAMASPAMEETIETGVEAPESVVEAVASLPNKNQVEVLPISPTTNLVNLQSSNMASVNIPSPKMNTTSYAPASIETLATPPDPLTDIVRSQRTEANPQKGGSLLEALLQITKEGAHAGLLLATASEFAHRYRKTNKTRGKRKGHRKTLKKRK